jgi:hypothetical protein
MLSKLALNDFETRAPKGLKSPYQMFQYGPLLLGTSTEQNSKINKTNYFPFRLFYSYGKLNGIIAEHGYVTPIYISPSHLTRLDLAVSITAGKQDKRCIENKRAKSSQVLRMGKLAFLMRGTHISANVRQQTVKSCCI